MNYRWLLDINNLSVSDHPLDQPMIWAAKYLIFGVFAVLAVLLVIQARRRRWWRLAAVGAGLGVAYLGGLLAAALHPERRPFTAHPRIHLLIAHPAGQSFPSDHATAAFAVAFAVTAFISVRWGLLLLAVAVLIGFARVFDGLHYPGDIGGGLLVAAIGVGTAAAARAVAARHQTVA